MRESVHRECTDPQDVHIFAIDCITLRLLILSVNTILSLYRMCSAAYE
jgi:hypothetical protein